ncbi:uncharacterized protein LOC110863414 [Folsomia candida]|uniref:von Willebrand factor A domain-containing protein 5A n=1 Tax=Folsomia candida TaxID=158441 RepID=A0A226EZU2_FOLCA|nr:uncharacterized protein LOC110863414 [Folsomia candida]OXA63089.1 von Willebrand factor A domain-containing protein 5A [Folsomia candida]
MASTDLMHRIVALQQFDGSFNLDPTVCAAISVNHTVVSQRAQQRGWDSKAFAVTLVLAFLKEKLASLQDDWELIADKSRIWLMQNAAHKADEMFDEAVKIVA